MDNLPSSVREQEKRMKELVAELNEQKASQEDTTAGENTGDTVTDEYADNDNADNDNAEDVGQQSETVTQESDFGDGTPVEQTQKERTDYKAMYHTLKGKYDAEVPRLHSTMNALQKRLVDLENTLAQSGSTDPRVGKKEEASDEYEITDEEREAFGDDLLAVVQKQTQRLMIDREKDYLRQIEELKSQVGQVGQKMQVFDTKSFYDELAKQVPDFKEINVDPGFLRWLDEVDPYSGERKLDLLRRAGDQYDVARASSFFNVYKSLTGRGGSNARTVPKQNPLEKHISPNKGASAEPVGKSGKSKGEFTRDEVAKFYSDVVEGKYKGRDSERRQIENDIISAGKEGRIR